MIGKNWLKERWFEFRSGQGYAGTIFSVLTFLLLAYESGYIWIKSPILFGVLFLIIFIPSITLMGHFHVKYQMPTEFKLKLKSVLDEIKELREEIEKMREEMKK